MQQSKIKIKLEQYVSHLKKTENLAHKRCVLNEKKTQISETKTSNITVAYQYLQRTYYIY